MAGAGRRAAAVGAGRVIFVWGVPINREDRPKGMVINLHTLNKNQPHVSYGSGILRGQE